MIAIAATNRIAKVKVSQPKKAESKVIKQREESAREIIANAAPRLTCTRRGENYSLADVAALYGMSLKSATEMVKERIWKGKKAKGAWIVSGDSIADWVEAEV